MFIDLFKMVLDVKKINCREYKVMRKVSQRYFLCVRCE
jgi:hypothetical protein